MHLSNERAGSLTTLVTLAALVSRTLLEISLKTVRPVTGTADDGAPAACTCVVMRGISRRTSLRALAVARSWGFESPFRTITLNPPGRLFWRHRAREEAPFLGDRRPDVRSVYAAAFPRAWIVTMQTGACASRRVLTSSPAVSVPFRELITAVKALIDPGTALEVERCGSAQVVSCSESEISVRFGEG
jgi:hypothetical protein